MGSKNHPKLYAAHTVETVRSAYYELWSEIEADQLRDMSSDDECKAAIIRRLLDLVDLGATSREELIAKVLSDRPCLKESRQLRR